MIFILVVAAGIVGVGAGFVLAISGGYAQSLFNKNTKIMKKNYAITRNALHGIVLTTEDSNARLEAEIALREIVSNEID